MKKERFFLRIRTLFIVLAFIIIILVSCSKNGAVQPAIVPIPIDTTTQATDTTHNTTDTIYASGNRYLALGDSYTIGQSVDSSQRFPAQTVALLQQMNLHFAPIQYIATTGWTTTNLMDAINLQKPQGPFDAVTLLIGVNDQYQTHDTTYYRSRFTSLLNMAVSLAGNLQSHVFVLSIPDYGVTPFGHNQKEISAEIDEFNAINKQVTLSYGISYTDVTIISRNVAGDASMIAFDGLHPSGTQYAQWAQALEPAMLKVLR